MENDKVRENRVRRGLGRMGYRLSKSRARDPRAPTFGRYAIEDAGHYATTSEPPVGLGVYALSLDDIETWLRSGLTVGTMTYLVSIPSSVPAGKIVAHNNVRPTRQLGSRGFRAWLDVPSNKYKACSCGWAPELETHYHVAESPRTKEGRKALAAIRTARGA